MIKIMVEPTQRQKSQIKRLGRIAKIALAHVDGVIAEFNHLDLFELDAMYNMARDFYKEAYELQEEIRKDKRSALEEFTPKYSVDCTAMVIAYSRICEITDILWAVREEYWALYCKKEHEDEQEEADGGE